jgi:hypothetical protein
MIKNITLNYDFTKFMVADYDSTDLSCIRYQVTEQRDTHDKYGGFPKTYGPENTNIHQLWWTSDEVDFVELGKQLGMEVMTVSTIRQDPGNIIPVHRDEFYQIKTKHPDRHEKLVRANIFLEDWKMGHFLQYNDTVVANWVSGTGFMWDREILHLSANAGLEHKYTLQISGFLLDDNA